MNQKEDDIDDIFKKKLGNGLNSEIPESFLADINAKLDDLEQKKKRRALWIWFVPALLAAGGLSLGVIWLTGETPAKGPQNANNSRPEARNDTQHNNQFPLLPNQAETINPGNAAPVKQNNQPVNNSTGKNVNKNETNALNTYAVKQKERSSLNRYKKSEGGNSHGNERQTRNERTETSDRDDKNQAVLDHVRIVDGTRVPGNDDVKDVTVDDAVTLSEAIAQTDTNSNQSNSGTAVVINNDPPVDSSKFQAPPVPTTSKYNTDPKFSFAFAAGAQYVQNTFPGDTVSPYFTKRKNEEKPLWGLDASAMFNVHLKSWEISSGFNYSEWGEKTNYTATKYRFEYIDGYTVDTATGDTSAVVVQGESVNNNVATKNNRNKYHYLSIPIAFGYTITLGRLQLVPKAGMSIGRAIGPRTGHYYGEDRVTLTSEKNNNWLFNAYGAIDIKLKFEKYSLFVSPYYRRNLNLLVGSKEDYKPNTSLYYNYPTHNKYQAFGLNFGINFYLQ